MVEVDDPAPDFALRGPRGDELRTVMLSEAVRDGPVVLAVYVFDFSPVSAAQLRAVEALLDRRPGAGLSAVGVAADGPFAHRAFRDEEGLSLPLLCDNAGIVAERYGVLQAEENGIRGVPRRSLFLVDRDCRLQFAWVAEDNWAAWDDGPIAALERALDDLSG